MLEDELREMFGSRVRTPPATMDSAGLAVQQGRRSARRRRVFSGIAAVVAFAMLVSSAAILQVFSGPTGPVRTDVLTYDGIYGGANGGQPIREADRPSPALAMPLDVFDGSVLWTADGEELALPGGSNVSKVARIPAGWLYSDESRLLLLADDGGSAEVRSDVRSWTVSLDGSRVALLTGANRLETWRLTGGLIAEAIVPAGTWPAGFDGESNVVLVNSANGFDHWSGGGGSSYQQTWNENVLAVYGALRDRAIGVVQEPGRVCLADLIPAEDGWQPELILGCGELAALAASPTTVRSPDGKWLAIPSQSGLELVDLAAVRAKGTQPGKAVPTLTAAISCVAKSFAEAVWADDRTVLTPSALGGAVACGIDGTRRAVPLTASVRSSWSLVPIYGAKAESRD